MKKAVVTVVVFLIFALTARVFAGWVIHLRSSDDLGDVIIETVWVQDNKFKSQSEGEISIIDMNNRTMTVIDDQNRTYWQVGFDDARKIFKEAVSSFIDQALKEIPEDQRDMYRGFFDQMEDMYADIDPARLSAVDIKIEKTSDSETIAGYKADEYHVFVNGQLIEQKWIAKGLDISKHLNKRKIMESMRAFIQIGDDDLIYEYTDTYLELFDKGFEMKSVDAEGDLTEVTSVEEKQLDAGIFGVPDGYRKITVEEMMMMGFASEDDDDDEW
jgi:hypothetical protein